MAGETIEAELNQAWSDGYKEGLEDGRQCTLDAFDSLSPAKFAALYLQWITNNDVFSRKEAFDAIRAKHPSVRGV